MKKKLSKLVPKKFVKRRGHAAETQVSGDKQRITNETVAAHREQMLKGARKYIYPLQHSKHKIVLISTTLFIATVIAFFSYSIVALYRWQGSSTFLYRVTQVIPFPIAKAGQDFISYENYLFELRHYTYYYEMQQELDFDSEAGQQQLAEFKKRALDKVVNDAYVKKLANKQSLTVSDQEVDDEIAIVRNQNRLGSSDQVLEDVLKDFWNWSIDDFKRSLRQELLAQKVVYTLDTETSEQAKKAMAELASGAEFAAVAQKYSEDPATKDDGGQFAGLVDRTNRDLSATTTDVLFGLQEGKVSDIVNVGYGLEILKSIETREDKVRGAHILFLFKDIGEYIQPLKDQQKVRLYVTP